MTAVEGALARALDRVWSALGDRSSLFPELPDDAVLARATSGEVVEAMPRLLELAISGAAPRMAITEPFDLLAASAWATWPAHQRTSIEDLVDTWWEWTRSGIDPDIAPGRVLACLCRLGLPTIRWLGPWLDDLDGPAARHLAEVVIGQLPEPEWEAIPDQRSQVLAWCRSEPVVIGLTVVGGTHLEEGQLGAALDQML